MIQITSGRALLDPEKILSEAGMKPGMIYVDLGAGTLGHFDFPAAQIIGEKGIVYAVDILKSALSAIETRANVDRVTNIKTVWGDIERVGGVRVADGTADMVSLVNVVSLARNNPAVVEEAKRLLKSGGTLFLVDWNEKGGAIGPAKENRISAEEAKKIFSRHFTLVKEFNAGREHWGLVFKK